MINSDSKRVICSVFQSDVNQEICVSRGRGNLTITTKPVDQDNSNFYGKFFIKLPTTFILYDFSNEQLRMVEKFSLDRLLPVDRFTEG